MLVADRMRQDQMRNILCLDEKEFDNALLEWVLQFGFRIDGSDVVFVGGDVQGFISELDRQFKQWIQSKTGKKQEELVPFFAPPPLTQPVPENREKETPASSPAGKTMPEGLQKILTRRADQSRQFQKKREERIEHTNPQIQAAIEAGDFSEAKGLFYYVIVGD